LIGRKERKRGWGRRKEEKKEEREGGRKKDICI
jgi:hypothetical protein